MVINNSDVKNWERQIEILKERFEENSERHRNIRWDDVVRVLADKQDKQKSLIWMEESGGEPDLVEGITTGLAYVDCSVQTPKGRRSLCYDQQAWESRKAHKPRGSAVALAHEQGVELLTEEQYQILQTVGEFDTTTSSWLLTPKTVREKGGAIYGDRRYSRVFIYHNGAESYYAVRGFRAILVI